MVMKKDLAGGGDTAVEKMVANSALLGVDIIELLWIPRNKLPHFGIIKVTGYKFPRISGTTNIYDEEKPDSEWIDGTLKFYPDSNGNCFGYVYDTDENRDLIASSLANGWFRIMDKRTKEEIISLAEEKGYPTKPFPELRLITKRSSVEKKAVEAVSKLEKDKMELTEKLKALETQLLIATEKKATQVNKRLRGKKVEVQEEEEESK